MHENFITEAATRGAGLSEDCYELSVLRMFCREHIGAVEDGETVLSEDHEKVPRITQAIDELSGEDSQKVWECVYVTGIIPTVLLITSGKWDEAYALYRSVCEELFEVFVAGHLQGYDPDRWVEAWIQARLADTPVEALACASQGLCPRPGFRGEVAARGGVIPMEDWRVHGWRFKRSLLGVESGIA